MNFGRFGWIEPGTPLPLNEREARDVIRDSRLKRTDKVTFPLEFKPAAGAAAAPEKEALYDRLNREFEINETPEKRRGES